MSSDYRVKAGVIYIPLKTDEMLLFVFFYVSYQLKTHHATFRSSGDKLYLFLMILKNVKMYL